MEANEKKWASAGLKPAQEKFEEAQSTMDPKTKRLVEWNSDVLARLLRHIIARRNAHLRPDTDTAKPSGAIVLYTKPGQMVLDEVMEIIHLPEFDPEAAKNQEDPDSIEIDSVALGQLREYVTMIASMYRKNPFHNFEHASHGM